MNATSEPQLCDVEWVAEHHEAHGQLLVRGSSLGEIITKATGALAGHFPPVGQAGLRVRPGWWCVTTCECRGGLAVSNHPGWHYRRARSNEAGSWYGAEIRFGLRGKTFTRSSDVKAAVSDPM
ncbi:hypothetical protein H4W30_002506 [Amycolatopsis roodepoortensis]|uniref:Uncharacterized protein n=1 Tax=Amycolatopsis roodepoortensis TaxID=700274 RepID=A0ABR9L406_9PSEU|nr:hypothetical protein [Amycolatopsis roodepoortensis]